MERSYSSFRENKSLDIFTLSSEIYEHREMEGCRGGGGGGGIRGLGDYIYI